MLLPDWGEKTFDLEKIGQSPDCFSRRNSAFCIAATLGIEGKGNKKGRQAGDICTLEKLKRKGETRFSHWGWCWELETRKPGKWFVGLIPEKVKNGEEGLFESKISRQEI